jgi:hypothetical protein
MEQIADALEEDPRVRSVAVSDDLDESWCIERRAFPSPAENDGLVLGSDVLHALQFSDHLVIQIELARYPEDEEIPSEYTVVWDGFLAVVAWRSRHEKPLASFEGEVVKEVLADALDSLGMRLYLQGCNPECEHKFAHTAVRFVPDPNDPDEISYLDGSNWAEVHADAPLMDDEDLVRYFFTDLLLAIRSFAVLKNLGQRILELEADGHQQLSQLMEINFERAQLPNLSPVARSRARWQGGGWLRRSKLLIARLWLTLSNIEYLRREWSGERFQFEGSSDERGLRKLFDRDFADEVDRVQSLDLSLMRSAVQEMAERLDTRALLRVTAVAAIAGAVAGGLVGGLASAGF